LLWDNQKEPLLIPFSEYEEIFQSTSAASDGQYQTQVYLGDSTEFYVAGAGRFNVEDKYGWDALSGLIDRSKFKPAEDFSHAQMQTFLGAMGAKKGYDIWIPQNDRQKLERTLIERVEFRNALPQEFGNIINILQEVDVIWLERGLSKLRALFEVEHSTPIYSGLLRFNDIHLVSPNLHPRFSIVANEVRRSLFVKQIRRPTFQTSGLNELCTFFEYTDVAGWFNRTRL
jgi:hypothetical protein